MKRRDITDAFLMRSYLIGEEKIQDREETV